jgi:hypothetical protein
MNGEHVQAGDTLIVKSSGTPDYVKTVRELAYTLYDVGAGNPLSFTTKAIDNGDIIVISADEAATSRDGTYTVKKKYVVNGSVVDDHIEIEDAEDLALGQEDLAHVRITTAGGTVKFDSTVDGTTGKVSLGDWCNVRLTSDFADGNPANAAWRVERTMNDVELASSDFSVDATTKVVTVNSGVTVTVDSVVGVKPVSFATMYMEYMAMRQDLQNVAEVSSAAEATELLGKYDARNPLRVGVQVALANTSTSIKVYGLSTDDSLGYDDFIERTSHLNDVYAVVALTYDTTILGSLKSAFENYADPSYVLDHGIKQKFRTVIGAVDLATQNEVVPAIGGASALVVPGTIPSADLRTLTVTVQTSQVTALDFSSDDVIPGDLLSFTYANTAYGPFTIAHVNAGGATTSQLEVDSDGTALPIIPGGGSSNDNDILEITNSLGTVPKCSIDHNTVGVRNFTITSTALDALYLTLSVPDATFVDDGVVPGDLVQMPTDPEATTWTTFDTWVVASVDSQTRLKVQNLGSNDPDVQNELPHGLKRTIVTDHAVTMGSLYVRVVRNMTKTEQVNYMLATAQSLNSKRALICYPNLVDVTDLVDGSLTRTGTDPMAASAQPGYYLSCLVGGQTAGQPSHQGLTNLGGSGISRIYNSNDYFSEEQLTNLSNGGVYVFIQDTASSLPYTIHEVTTDVLALETGEYMHVKNLDYLSMSFLSTLRPFIGVWNITPDALSFITQSLYATIARHKSDYRAKIGAPLIDARVRAVYQNTDISEDRVEAYIDADTPTVLNTIGLHLVA